MNMDATHAHVCLVWLQTSSHSRVAQLVSHMAWHALVLLSCLCVACCLWGVAQLRGPDAGSVGGMFQVWRVDRLACMQDLENRNRASLECRLTCCKFGGVWLLSWW
jgi:hypothetical protein